MLFYVHLCLCLGIEHFFLFLQVDLYRADIAASISGSINLPSYLSPENGVCQFSTTAPANVQDFGKVWFQLNAQQTKITVQADVRGLSSVFSGQPVRVQCTLSGTFFGIFLSFSLLILSVKKKTLKRHQNSPLLWSETAGTWTHNPNPSQVFRSAKTLTSIQYCPQRQTAQQKLKWRIWKLLCVGWSFP